MSKYKSIDVIYVGDKDVTDEETALAEKNVLLIKSYKIIKNDQCYILIMTTTDGQTIGPCMMTYDTFNYPFTKGYVASAAYEVQ